MESKEYSWARLEADRLLSHGPCELLYVDIEPSAANGRCYIRMGPDTNAPIVHTLKTSANTNVIFRPAEPVFLPDGLFIDIDEKVTSVFIQWRELGHKAGG